MRSANLAVKFLLELAAFAAFAYWGAVTWTGAAAVVAAIAAPAVAVAVWGVFAAPRYCPRGRAPRSLSTERRAARVRARPGA
jgi:hypothetical protein